MARSRKARTLLIVLSIPVVLVVGAAVALKLYFTEERLKELVVPVLADATQREVSLHGISLSIFPGFGLEMDSLVIANKRGQGFSDRPYVALDRLVINLRLLALLKNSLEVTNMVIDRPRIFLEVNAAGKSNYTNEPATDLPPGQDQSSAGTGGAAALFSNVQIRNGRLEYLNHLKNTTSILDGLAMTLQGEMVPAVNELHLSTTSTVENFSYGTTTSLRFSGLRLALEQNVVYNLQKDLLTLSNGRARVQNIALGVNGSISNLSERFMMDINIESETVNIADLMSLVPGEYQKNAKDLKGNGVARIKLAITGTVDDTTVADIAGSIRTTGASIQYAGLPKAITNVTIASDFERSAKKQEFTVSSFSALLGTNPVRATMKMVNFDDPHLALTAFADFNLAEVKDYYPLEKGTQLSGALKAEVNIAGRMSAPEALKSSGTMEFKNVIVRTASSQRPLENLNGTVTFSNQVVEAKRLSMTLGKSDMALSFRLRNYLSLMSDDPKASRAVANLTLTSNLLSTADLLSEEKAGEKGSGGAAPAGQKGGGLPLPNVEMDVAATIGKLVMEKMTLENVRGTMKISNGVITMQNFTCNTFGGSVVSKGTMNLQNPDRPLFDLALDLKDLDAHEMLPQFTTFGQRLFGRLSMNTTLKGALDDTLGLIPQTLSGLGNARIESGKVQGVKVNQELAAMLKLPDLEVINFKDWSNGFTITDGKFHIKDLKITALGADYLVDGTYGLDGVLDYGMSVLLTDATSAKVSVPGFVGEAAGLFKDESGRMRLDFKVTGTSENPRVSFDASSAQRRGEELAKQRLEAEKKKLEEDLKKKGGDLLKKLLPGGK